MAWVAVAIGGSALIGAGASMFGASEQAGAADHAAELQNQQYMQTREDFAPWRNAGGAAVTRQADLMGLNGLDPQNNAFSQFREDPGYKYTVDQAIQGVDRSAAARGLLTSGATIKAIQDRASNLADQQYGNWFNRLASIAGTGQTATGSTASAGANAANNAGNAAMAAGNARASGYSGVASSLNQGLNNWFSQPGGGGGYGGGATAAGNLYAGYGAGNAGYQNFVQAPEITPNIGAISGGFPSIF